MGRLGTGRGPKIDGWGIDDHCDPAIGRDGNRWAIETLFGILKSRGFNLEDTHLKEMERFDMDSLTVNCLCS